ncbi:putative secreted protein (Por secretion system target) [Maribacter vaceletii]|uniref:Putative secreted protein (Por secretion system target) n=1 Tax=Maribacter vaceletii TaxID=1206816 RepID=A0A495E998_9FLAO|nr:T9SS type A sorting domain-containing protein [Maribacter vaceletii]RKR13504.1 putative secreted protein (Por secretion system target) [Maribacter vaceletii]
MKIILKLIAFFLCYSAFSKDIYVAKDGNDSNSGTIDFPYLTISKAANEAVAGDNVFIREGTYEETLLPANSGENGNPITFQAYQNEKVIITAMQALSNWVEEGTGIYKTTVTWDLKQRNFVMNGTDALDLARWPNNTDGDRFTLNSLRNDGGSQDEVSTNAFLTDSEIPNWDWSNGGSLVFYGDRPGSGWTTWRAWIKSSTTGRINFDSVKNQTWIISAHPPGDLGDYYLEGIKEALDYENEWYFDTATKELFIKLPNGAAPADGEVKMARRERTIDLSNKNYITINNLAVFGGTVEISGNGNRLNGISSFYGSMTRGINPNFNSGVNAINIGWNAENTTVEKCEVGFGDGTGIWDSGQATTIKNCYVHNFDFLGSYDAPLMVRGQNNAKVLNNTVTRGGRDALQIISKGSEVAWNDISYSNLIADDCALLYTIGENLDMDIHHNWFHDAEGRGNLKKAAGIYLDNSAGDVRVSRNVVWNVEWTAIQINWNGTNIDIFNNTLVKADGGTMGAWHKEGTQFTNVKVWNNVTDKHAVNNQGNQETEATWEPQSDKQNNLVSNTIFKDFENNDFLLKENSEAIDFGREIVGYTENFNGASPDAGAYEFGEATWKPGVDWNINAGPTNKCYGLPGEGCVRNTIKQDNFRVLVTGESCSKNNDGSIEITATKTLNYKATITGSTSNSKDFTKTATFNNLKAGDYEVCITIDSNPDFEQCFKLIVEEPDAFEFSAKVSSNSKQVNLTLKGGDIFRINLNDELTVTDKNNITLNLKKGENNLVIKTDKDCQGIQEQKIFIREDNFTIYPNPIESLLNIDTNVASKNIEIFIYNLSGKLVYTNSFIKDTSTPITIDISNMPRGMYLAKYKYNGESKTISLIKK